MGDLVNDGTTSTSKVNTDISSNPVHRSRRNLHQTNYTVAAVGQYPGVPNVERRIGLPTGYIKTHPAPPDLCPANATLAR